MTLAVYLRQRFCNHEVYTEDVQRRSDFQSHWVEAPCHKCGKFLLDARCRRLLHRLR